MNIVIFFNFRINKQISEEKRVLVFFSPVGYKFEERVALRPLYLNKNKEKPLLSFETFYD